MNTRRVLVQTESLSKMSLRQKCKALGVHRSTLFYRPKPTPTDEVEVMNRIRELYDSKPFLGYRRITYFLQKGGMSINQKRVLRLMQKMRIQAIYPRANLSKRRMEDRVYPYLLNIYPPLLCNDAWQIDITYIRLSTGFMYLVALIDVISRRIMGWDLSPFLETGSALKALDQALSTGHAPWVINSDQGCQFTSKAWIERLKDAGIAISMDGKGRCIDNIYIERFWRSIKYEEVYLKSYEDVKTARLEIGAYIEWYNRKRPHQSLNNQTPNEAFESRRTSVESGDNSTSYPPLSTDTTTTKECMLNLKSNHSLSSKNAA